MADYNVVSVFAKIVKKQFSTMDMAPIMVYMVDVVAPDALPYLAKQFGVDGIRGWDLADTEAKQRDLIKNAIEIKKRVGTPYSIKLALKSIGFPNVVINERVDNKYNGTIKYNGLQKYGHGVWVNFTITISVDDVNAIPADTKDLIERLIMEYKPMRSKLKSLTFKNL